jgi:ATP-dependent DNA helicase PIF1
MVQGVLVNGSIGQVVRFDTPTEAAASKTRIARVDNGNDIDGRRKPKNHDITEEILKHDWKWPVVKFTNGMEFIVTPVDFTVTNGDGETMMARRLQLPLILAWALSVHKAQGQTLERVRVDLRRTFEKGQAYVALSRATTMEHLQVLNFSKEK